MNLKDNLKDIIQIETLRSEVSKINIESYLVGGFVRDLIIGIKGKDIDIMTIGDPFDLVDNLSKLKGFSKVSFYKNYGTASIKCNDYDLEFVGARKESYSSESRNPIVTSGLFDDDMNRRDFTINAICISLNKDYGNIIDKFYGIEDIKNKIIRTCDEPIKTFSDDPLRMIRAIRFASQLDFDIEEKTFESIIKNAQRIEIISKERISNELNKIILSKKPSYGFKLLYSSGLLKIIFPEMNNLQGVEKVNKHSHKDNFYHTLEVLDNISQISNSLWLRWAAILHDIAKPQTKRYSEKVGWTFHGHEDLGSKLVPKIFKRLRLPLDDKMKHVSKLVKLHLRPISLVKDHITDSAIRRLLYEAGDDIDDLIKYFTELFTGDIKRHIDLIPIIKSKYINYEWPGNIRELRNIIERHIILGDKYEEDVDTSQDSELTNQNVISLPLKNARKVFEKNYLQSQINRFDGNISKTASFIGMERSALHRKLKQLGLTEDLKK